MESINQYIKWKKETFEQHNLLNKLENLSVTRKWWQLQMISKEDFLWLVLLAYKAGPGTADGSTLCVKGSVKLLTPSAIKWISGFQLLLKIMSISLHWRLWQKSPCVTISRNTPQDQAMLETNKLKTTKGDSAALIAPVKLTVEAT